MNAVISGCAGVAMVLDGNEVLSLHVGSGITTTVRRIEDFRFLFGDATDLQFLEGVELDEVSHRLATDFNKELALQLSLVLLDSLFSPRTRQAASEELEVLFQNEEVARFVEGVLYAHPLSSKEADLAGASAYLPKDSGLVKKLLIGLIESQADIGAVRRAWEALPNGHFSGESERSKARAVAVRAGLFRDIVKGFSQGGEGAFSEILQKPTDLPRAELHTLLEEWISILRNEAEFSFRMKDSSETSEVESAGDIEEAINQAYEELGSLQAKLAQPGPAALYTQNFNKLRRLQTLKAEEIASSHEAAFAVEKGWELLNRAKRLLAA